MRSLIERSGARATVVPSMRELPLDDNPAAFHFAAEMFAGRVDATIFLTGVGARTLLETLETKYARDDIVAAMQSTTVIVRGPKPTVVLREWGIQVDHRAASPNTWRELIPIFDAIGPLVGKTCAIQEYGKPSEELATELRDRGAGVLSVPVYRWGLPENIAPLEDAVRATINGEFDVLMFTSAQQFEHVQQIAETLGRTDEWFAAARKCVIASIGPTNSEALRAADLPPDIEASPPKMGQLVRQTMQIAAEVLREK